MNPLYLACVKYQSAFDSFPKQLKKNLLGSYKNILDLASHGLSSPGLNNCCGLATGSFELSHFIMNPLINIVLYTEVNWEKFGQRIWPQTHTDLVTHIHLES